MSLKGLVVLDVCHLASESPDGVLAVLMQPLECLLILPIVVVLLLEELLEQMQLLLCEYLLAEAPIIAL